MLILIILTVIIMTLIFSVLGRFIYCLITKKLFTSLFSFLYSAAFHLIIWTSSLIAFMQNSKINSVLSNIQDDSKYSFIKKVVGDVVSLKNIGYVFFACLSFWVLGAFVIRILSHIPALNIYNVMTIVSISLVMTYVNDANAGLSNTYLFLIVFTLSAWIKAVFISKLRVALEKSKREKEEFRKEKE